MASQDRLVLDASVVIKWYVEEEGTDKALRILDDYSNGKLDLISVQLMPFEVINALRYARNFGTINLMKVAESLLKLQIGLFPLLDGLYKQAINFAVEYGTTVFDASYLSLAVNTDCVFYTADARFVDKVGKNKHVSLL